MVPVASRCESCGQFLGPNVHSCRSASPQISGLGYPDSAETTTTTYRTKPPTQAEIDELRRKIAARELALGLYRTEAAWLVNANAVSLVQSASEGVKAQVKPRFHRWRKRR